MEKSAQNTGVVEAMPRITDWQAAGETGIKYEVRLPDGDWTEYLPDEESQLQYNLDSFACVTFSALNCVETQMNYLLTKGLIPANKVQWLKDSGYINDKGRFNASDRFTAKMSGTSKTGNSLPNVWDSIRNHGLLPEKDWPFPVIDVNLSYDQKWDVYYADIPESLKAKAKKFLEYFDVRYEWTAIATLIQTPVEPIRAALKQAPVQVVTPLCPPWGSSESDPPIKACGGTRPEHATMVYGLVEGEALKDFDHYRTPRKRLSWSYTIPYAVKGVIMLKELSPTPSFKYEFKRDIIYGERSAEVKKLQDALKADGTLSEKIESTGFYGELTRMAVLNFQFKYNLATPRELFSLNGRRAGPATRKKLNELFNK